MANSLFTHHGERTPLSPRTPQMSDFPYPPSYSTSNLESYGTANTNSSRPHPPLPSPKPAFEISFADKFQPKDLARALTDFTSINTSDEEELKPSRKMSWTQRFYHLVVDWWLWELFSWVLSAFCLVSVATLLGYYDNKTLPPRWPGGISLNTAVAVLSGIAKYAMSVPLESALGQLKWSWFRSSKPRKLIDMEHYDDATRGPWGAISLLWHLRGKHLASYGAIIVFLSLTFEPFFQQIVAYPQKPGSFGKSALTRSVEYITRTTKKIEPGGNSTVSDNRMQVAVTDAFIYDGKLTNITPFCPTSNCKWPPFQTLAVCNKCQDISDLLTFGCMQESGTWLMSRAYRAMELRNTTNGNVTISTEPIISCGWFLNATSPDRILMSGYRLDTTKSPAEPAEALWSSSYPLIVASQNVTSWDRSYHFKKEAETRPLFDFMMALTSDPHAVYANATPMAAECVVRWCVKTIEAEVKNGVFSEHIISEFTNDTQLGYPKLHWSKWENDWEWTIDDVYIKPPGQNDTFFVPDDIAFSTVNPLRGQIPSYYTVTSNNSEEKFVQVWNTLFLENTSSPVILPFNMSTWSNPTNISQFVDGITRAMTNVMRNYPNSSLPVMGYGGLESYVHIQWGWFTVPLFLLLSTLILLLCTIAQSPSRREGGVWKTSTLAVMLHGMHPDARDEFGDSWSMIDIRNKARKLDVVLRTEARGLQFSMAEKDIKNG